MHRIVVVGCLALAFAARAADPDIKFEKYQLQNGLTVILSEDHRLPQVAVDVWYHVGAANQTAGKSGFAHLFEHMMFSGSRHVQPSPFQVLESVGASGMNGTTNFDRTNYFEVVPSNQLAAALWVESDRMGYLLDTLDEQKLRTQRDVVSNEKRQSYENRPYGLSSLRICDLLFPKPHPYYECVIGDIADIQAASATDVRQFFRTWYGPQNASLAIVGDFDPKVAREIVEKYFGPIPGGPAVKRPDIPQPNIGRVIKEPVEDKLAELPRLILVWKGVRQYTDEEPAGDVLADVLGTGKTSRLYKALVFERQLASGVSAGNGSYGLGGWFQITVTAARGHTIEEIRPVVEQIVVELQQQGPTKEEVERAQRNIIANQVRTVERIGGFGGKADLLNHYQTYLGDPGYLARDLARYRAVTPAASQAYANKFLIPNERIELDVVPAAKRTASAEGAQR
ncbi:MAG TPA: pitrilysin family protein [Myxococcales bacterium]|jgi:predicted Zn-dependent peptidase|nr:pitrilysin family protein [Myxococcales bacterium]